VSVSSGSPVPASEPEQVSAGANASGATEARTGELRAEDARALADRFDQLIGWAKAGKTADYYLMDRENVDRMRENLIEIVVAAGFRRVPEDADGPEVEITYRNHRGKVANRRIRPVRVWFGVTEWHPEPQWLLDAVDAEKGLRSFALCDVIDFGCRGVSVSGGGEQP
jgi:hypothetical protein